MRGSPMHSVLENTLTPSAVEASPPPRIPRLQLSPTNDKKHNSAEEGRVFSSSKSRKKHMTKSPFGDLRNNNASFTSSQNNNSIFSPPKNFSLHQVPKDLVNDSIVKASDLAFYDLLGGSREETTEQYVFDSSSKARALSVVDEDQDERNRLEEQQPLIKHRLVRLASEKRPHINFQTKLGSSMSLIYKWTPLSTNDVRQCIKEHEHMLFLLRNVFKAEWTEHTSVLYNGKFRGLLQAIRARRKAILDFVRTHRALYKDQNEDRINLFLNLVERLDEAVVTAVKKSKELLSDFVDDDILDDFYDMYDNGSTLGGTLNSLDSYEANGGLGDMAIGGTTACVDGNSNTSPIASSLQAPIPRFRGVLDNTPDRILVHSPTANPAVLKDEYDRKSVLPRGSVGHGPSNTLGVVLPLLKPGDAEAVARTALRLLEHEFAPVKQYYRIPPGGDNNEDFNSRSQETRAALEQDGEEAAEEQVGLLVTPEQREFLDRQRQKREAVVQQVEQQKKTEAIRQRKRVEKTQAQNRQSAEKERPRWGTPASSGAKHIRSLNKYISPSDRRKMEKKRTETEKWCIVALCKEEEEIRARITEDENGMRLSVWRLSFEIFSPPPSSSAPSTGRRPATHHQSHHRGRSMSSSSSRCFTPRRAGGQQQSSGVSSATHTPLPSRGKGSLQLTQSTEDFPGAGQNNKSQLSASSTLHSAGDDDRGGKAKDVVPRDEVKKAAVGKKSSRLIRNVLSLIFMGVSVVMFLAAGAVIISAIPEEYVPPSVMELLSTTRKEIMNRFISISEQVSLHSGHNRLALLHRTRRVTPAPETTPDKEGDISERYSKIEAETVIKVTDPSILGGQPPPGKAPRQQQQQQQESSTAKSIPSANGGEGTEGGDK